MHKKSSPEGIGTAKLELDGPIRDHEVIPIQKQFNLRFDHEQTDSILHMENIAGGITVVILALIGYILSWRMYRQQKMFYAVLFLSLCALLIGVYMSADLFLHTWDERYHALVAKNLMNHPLVPTLYEIPVLPSNEQSWVASNIWLHKQPVPLWLMALSMKIFGVNEWAVRIPSLIMMTLGVGILYQIGKFLFNNRVAYIAAFLFSVNGLILELASGRVATDHIDLHFLFFILLAVFFTIRFLQQQRVGYTLLTGLAIGAAILTKWLPALIVLPMWLLLVYEYTSIKKPKILFHFVLVLLTAAAIALPWQVYIYQQFPVQAAYEAEFNYRHFTEALDGRGAPFYYFINQIRINYGELIYLPLLWFVWKLFRSFPEYKRLAIGIWFFVPLAVFSFAQTKMQGYLLFTAPALFLMTAEFYSWISERPEHPKLKWLYKITLFLLIALPIRYGIERMKPFAEQERNPIWAQELRSLGEEPIEQGVIFNYKRNIEAMFYTNLTAYSELPDEEVIRELLSNGFRVIIHDDQLPDEVKNIEGVEIRRFTLEKP